MDRRLFLRSVALSSAGISAAGLLQSCETTTQSTEDDVEAAAQIATDGAEFEAMGIKTYEVAAASGLLTDQAVIDTALAFMADHQGHLAELNVVLSNLGKPTIDTSGAAPAPGTASVTNQTDILELALSVEFDAATFYFSGIVNTVRNTDLRKVFANILPIEVAHMITYKNVLGRTPAIDGAIFENLTDGS